MILTKDISENLTRRDYHILRYLIDGPEMFEHIRSHLATIEEKLPGEEHKLLIYKMTQTHLYKKLCLLGKRGFIVSMQYRTPRDGRFFSLYALTDAGLGELIKSNLSIEFWRQEFYGKYTVSHDLQVTSVVRKVRQEMIDNNIPHGIEDEISLKKKWMGGKRKKVFPDLYLKLILPMPAGKTRTLNLAIEIDNDTLPSLRVAEKVGELFKQKGWPTMLLCNTKKRMDELLRRYSHLVMSEIKKAERKGASKEGIEEIREKYKLFMVAELYDFLKNGMLGTTWERADSSKAVLVPSEKTK